MKKNVIKFPIISEKSTELGARGTYVFSVIKSATTPEIKKAVKETYNVDAVKVNVVNVKPKTRRLGRSIGQKPGYRKVFVTLKTGQKLDILPQ